MAKQVQKAEQSPKPERLNRATCANRVIAGLNGKTTLQNQ